MAVIVADLMTRSPITISPEMNLLECTKMMVKKKVGSLLLVQNKKLVGLITDQDILWALVKKSKTHLSRIKAIDISPKKLATIRPTASILETIDKMKRLKFERLPVIDKGELMGVITARDILNFKPEIYPELEELSEIREESQKLERVKKAKRNRIIDEGICEECGSRGTLYRTHGMLICESCKNLI